MEQMFRLFMKFGPTGGSIIKGRMASIVIKHRTKKGRSLIDLES